ncbi:hypothetical protein JRO89_XS07G0183100 [Xanthoceras sorbifolium]|uniref:Protein FAR1-RELATED SEQUENCE n=1 Tax=Xanthoceras sorbifolium TaxID=99658 RepID=A0ABQ8HU49_9ROSI|nr:hypothetical protein JRO89_XS07G0183100 [Xanthoceras sorbifolium]
MGNPLKSQWSMENQMAELYTQRSFYIFQDELWNTLIYKIDKKMENDDCCVYKVDKRNEVIDRAREIICEKPSGFASCNCKKFESEGVFCRHLLSYFNLMQVAFLPSHYILKIWTKAAKCDIVVDDKGSEEASKILEDDLNNVLSKVKSVVKSDSIFKRHSSTLQIYNEPLTIRAKGCRKRLKGGKEKAKGKIIDNSKHCNGCGKVNHEDFNEGIIQDEAKKKASLNS